MKRKRETEIVNNSTLFKKKLDDFIILINKSKYHILPLIFEEYTFCDWIYSYRLIYTTFLCIKKVIMIDPNPIEIKYIVDWVDFINRTQNNCDLIKSSDLEL